MTARTALHAVSPPRWVRILGVALGPTTALAFFALGVVPWQQTAVGRGTVIAYAPSERQQAVDAPISGRVVRWAVQEGQRVTAGQEIVELRDNDAELFERILKEQALIDGQLSSATGKVSASEMKVAAAMMARTAAIGAAEAKVTSAEQKVLAERESLSGAEATFATASIQQERADRLEADGLRSTQDAENARLKTDTARAKRDESSAKLASAEADLSAALREVAKIRAEADGKVAASQAELLVARNEASDYSAKRLAVETKLARQDAQTVLAPTDGVIIRVLGGQGGEQVKAGDALVSIVPDTDARAVAVAIDGNDVRFVRPGQQVRVVFEGWPSIQVSGWPATSVGTFGGVVDFIDAAGDGKGSFRVLVVPQEGSTWPDGELLRQGGRANAWVMLGNVPLGYELWRRLNDFPPEVPATKTKDSDPTPVEREKSGRGWLK